MATAAGRPLAAPVPPRNADPTVDVVIHIVLAVPHALPGVRGEWYCDGPKRLAYTTPIPQRLLAAYERELATYGRVTDHFGYGTWMAGQSDLANVAFEEGDHVEIATRLSIAKRFLPAFLARLRRDLDQREALGEILGGGYGTPEQRRERIDVTVPFAHADYEALLTIHRIFGDDGRGGASQYEDATGVHIASGTAPEATARIERKLRAAGFAYRTEPETFVVDDAPACPH